MRVRHIFYAVAVLQLGIFSTVSAESLSPKEQAWFETFQKGTIYAKGWREITAELVAKAPAEIKCDLRQRLDALGAKIGREWSKNNTIRKIDSAMLRQWGDMLEEAAEREPEKISQAVDNLDRKVLALLN
ncbi:hypothetical protein [Candidatus Electronema sp. JM]|uniref:hypothetical protein n=1 Tax=Candidatus Electronema sp. JM TaxID=3401571 RepID=UPI003AA93723